MAPERVRRPPPPLRRAVVARVEELSPRLVQVTLQGPELAGLVVEEPAASVRVLLPGPGTDLVVMPVWAGNEFLLPDGSRPAIRTLTPRRSDPDARELDVAVVVHGTGAASQWARGAAPGRPVAVSGPGRGYAVPEEAGAFLLVGDETALPAIGQLLEWLPAHVPVEAHVELATADARIPLAERPGAAVQWHELPPGQAPGAGMLAAASGAPIDPETHLWVAGEAAAVQRIRRMLFEERGVPRGRATIRGYWKHGRAARTVDQA